MIAFAFASGLAAGLVVALAWGAHKHSLGYRQGFTAASEHYTGQP